MKARYDWQTDEEWPDELPADPPAPRRRFRPGWLLIGLLLLSAVGVLGYRARQVVTAENERVVAEVRATYALLEEALNQEDQELFEFLLAGPSQPWAQEQQALMAAGLFLGRAPFDLHTAGSATSHNSAQISLSPDLNRAEIMAAYEYSIAGTQENITLQHTFFLQRSGFRWLMAAPGTDYWGAQVMTTTRHFTLTFPEQDQELAGRLAADLENMTGDLCRLPDLACPDEFHLEIHLASAPVSLLHTAALTPTLTAGRVITLPAPSLVGLPEDEAGYNALYRGYAAHAGAALIADFVDYRCCNQGLLFQALLAYQWRELGLRAWPPTQADYRYMLRHPFSLNNTNRYWANSFDPHLLGTRWRNAYVTVEYATATLNISPAALQRRLRRASSPANWLTPYLGNFFNPPEDAPWFEYIHEQAYGPDIPPDRPEQDVQLVCGIGRTFFRELHRYAPLTDTEISEASFRLTNIHMWPLPGDRGVIVQEKGVNPGTWRILYWQDGQETALMDATNDAGRVTYSGISDPTGRFLLMQHEDVAGQYALLDLDTCRTGECDLIPLPGYPTWSPDGQSLIITLTDGDYTELWQGETNSWLERKIGRASLPFWIDNTRFGYVGITAIMAINEAGTPFPLLSLAELAEEGGYVLPPTVSHIAGRPGQPQQLLIAAYDAPSDSNAIFLFDQQSGVLSLLWQTEAGNIHRAGFSPTGRWITVDLQRPNRMINTLYLYDLESESLTTYSSLFTLATGYDWSADGRWLLKTDNYMLSIIDPARDYQFIHPYDAFTTCYMAAWVNRD